MPPWIHEVNPGLAAFAAATLFLLLLTFLDYRSRFRKPAGSKEKQSLETSDANVAPGDYAGRAAIEEALARLVRLPQFHQALDARLTDWAGAILRTCHCDRWPESHLLVTWGTDHGVTIVTRSALESYMAYQEKVANLLTAGSLRSNGTKTCLIPNTEGEDAPGSK